MLFVYPPTPLPFMDLSIFRFVWVSPNDDLTTFSIVARMSDSFQDPTSTQHQDIVITITVECKDV